MMGLSAPGLRVFLSVSDDPKRKLAHALEIVEVDDGRGPTLVGINTARAEPHRRGGDPRRCRAALAGYGALRREVRYGRNSRIDILLEGEGRPPAHVEVKNVHLVRRPGLAESFRTASRRAVPNTSTNSPDVVAGGGRAVMVYLVPPATTTATGSPSRRPTTRATRKPSAPARARGVEAIALNRPGDAGGDRRDRRDADRGLSAPSCAASPRRSYRVFITGPAMTYVDATTSPQRNTGKIKLHGPEAFEGMRRAGRLAAEALDMLVPHAKPGVTTAALDRLVYDFALDHGALPALVDYRGYAHAICTSINHVVCHGIPNDKTLRDGDVVNIDVTLLLDGWHGDTSRMYAIGEIPRRAERLLDITHEALMRACMRWPARWAPPRPATSARRSRTSRKPSAARWCAISAATASGGHPRCAQHPALRPARRGRVELKPGMIFTIEPMINLGRGVVKILSDGWTAVTRDRSLSAQFEHTVGVTETGVEVFTYSPAGLDKPPYGRA